MGNEAPDAIRGISFMWDEAKQRARGILALAKKFKLVQKSMQSQKYMDFLVVLASVGQGRQSATGDKKWSWQPWVCQPIILESTKADFIWEGLNKVLPISFGDKHSIRKFAEGVHVALLVGCMDFASSNISTATRALKVIADWFQGGL
jgi:hypothetical protein